jgi:hypothetical protein
MHLAAWPDGDAKEFSVPRSEAAQLPVSVRKIRREGDLVLFEIGN